MFCTIEGGLCCGFPPEGNKARRLNERTNQTKIRNRRYEAMKELLSKGDYFSDDEMKRRDPLLYDQMVGTISHR